MFEEGCLSVVEIAITGCKVISTAIKLVMFRSVGNIQHSHKG